MGRDAVCQTLCMIAENESDYEDEIINGITVLQNWRGDYLPFSELFEERLDGTILFDNFRIKGSIPECIKQRDWLIDKQGDNTALWNWIVNHFHDIKQEDGWGDITYDSIQRCFLRTAHGVRTPQKMPTLREALEVCKDRIVVNIDQGYEFYDMALKISEELGVTEQMLIKGKRPAEAVAAKFGEYEHNMMYMPIIDILKPQGQELFGEYMSKGIVPLAYEVCWNEYTPEVKDCMEKVVESGSKLWVNSLWESLCGGLCDDVAWESGDPGSVYGKLLDMGATMIQTDRPELLISYLRSQGRHD